MPKAVLVCLAVFACSLPAAHANEQLTARLIKVGVAAPLSGELAALGDNLRKSVQTYERRYLRHPISFIFEDARKGSFDGLAAYRKLINIEHVHVLVGGTTSNGTLAAAPLINQSQTVLLTPLTGGTNIDSAGPYIFRIGNSDILNGRQQADLFLTTAIKRAALLTEATEYTQDIAAAFRQRFREGGGELVFDEDFLPDHASFRSEITRLKSKHPQAVFMVSQTGVAFGIFAKELRSSGGGFMKLHTNFLSAANPDARSAGGTALDGACYLAPAYDQRSNRLRAFFEHYEQDHGHPPVIAFHTAGLVDALDLLQSFLDTGQPFSGADFRSYLLLHVKRYSGLMGIFSFDENGNSDIGFTPARITSPPPRPLNISGQ